MNQAALIVVDMQNGFIGSRTEQIIPAVEGLIMDWQKQNADNIVFTRFTSLAGGQYERLIGWKRLQVEPETNLCPQIAPLARNIINKNYYTAFTTELKELVSKQGWKTFGICGIATDSCVLKTAVDAFELGYTPYVLADACASHGGIEVHDAAIRLLGRFIGKNQIITSKEFIERFNK